jgi:muramoyltetrapeptide carboxypeptidase
MDRRHFLRSAALAGAAAAAVPQAGAQAAVALPPGPPPAPVRPPRLAPGATIGLAAPAGALRERAHLGQAVRRLEALGFRTRVAPHALDRHGYLAGTDADRAADLHSLFEDPGVDAVMALRGGWGSARLLPLLDFDLLGRHPKAFVGYSDVTTLLLALYARTGLVTFHGPVGTSPWGAFTAAAFRRVLCDGARVRVEAEGEGGVPPRARTRARTITPGRAEGRLVGGNLTVVAALVGSGYLPDWSGHVLFLEDTNESTYQVDRLLTQLRLAGLLGGVAAVVFGTCTGCRPSGEGRVLALDDVLADHLRPLGIPAWSGAMIGHADELYTLPLGVSVGTDAERGTLEMLEPAVI